MSTQEKPQNPSDIVNSVMGQATESRISDHSLKDFNPTFEMIDFLT
jgi:hypothetical protein